MLFLLQKKIVKILTGSDYRAHSESLFIELKIMNVFQLHRYFTGILVYKSISNMYFKYWNNLFHQSNNLRFPNDLKIKYFKKKITQSSVQYSGPKIWNTFSAKTKMSTKFVYYEMDFEKRNPFSLINHTFIFIYLYLTRYRYNFMQILLIIIKVKSGLE